MANISLETLKNIWANNGISETLQNAAEATGNGTAFDVDGYGVGRLVVSGTFSATIVPEGSIDGTNYFAIPVVDISTGVSALSITAKGNYLVNCQGLSNIRARISDYTSGTVTVLARVEKGSIPAGTGLIGKVGIDQVTDNANEVVVKSGEIQLTGSNMELYGATINDRPDADTVAAGTTFTIVDENLDQNWISDGTNWKEV